MIKRGMILAAGLGSRMRPLTHSRPKPLCELLGKPLIEYALDNFLKFGVHEVLINTHYLSEQIPNYLGKFYGKIKITYQHEEEILDSGGAINRASKFLLGKPGPYLLSNADTPVNFNHINFNKFSNDSNKNVLFAQQNLPNGSNRKNKFDLAWDKKGNLVEIRPQKLCRNLSYGKFSGYQLLSEGLLKKFPKQEKYSYVSDFYIPEIKMLDLKVDAGLQNFADISTARDLLELNLTLLIGLNKNEYFKRFRKIDDGIYVGKNVDISETAKLVGPLILDDNSRVESGAQVGPFVVLGKSAYICQNSVARRSVIFSRSFVPAGQRAENSIVCDDLTINLKKEKDKSL